MTGFDHEYTTYADVLARHVRMPRVDYAALKAHRRHLDRAVAELNVPPGRSLDECERLEMCEPI